MKLQEQISRIQSMMGVISENTKSTNKEFNKYKDSKFNTLRDYTLQDIVDNWESLSDHKNENIKTIKYFVNNPNKITDLVYDEKGLEDGYHRLIAAKILKKPRFKYKLVENINKSMMGKIIHNNYDTDLLKESISINNPSTDDYNEIMVDGEKVGYIILSPARKEYYWVDVNLPNPLSIVDIKIFDQFRGKKYMKETMNWLYDFAKENGYKSLFLRVDDDSEVSQETLFQIYQKYGFSIYRTTDDEEDIYMFKLL